VVAEKSSGRGGDAISLNADYAALSDAELLGKLIGARQSRQLYKGSLQPLFSSGDAGRPPEKCVAARELVKRWLAEELRSGSALTSPGSVRDYLKLILANREYEVFVCLWLDAQHRVIKTEEAFRGTLTQTSVYPREIVKAALAVNAAAVIFAHNHPSGVAQPSQADEYLTRNLKDALALVEVKVLDHFIVAGANTISFSERGLL
jgi:DNA repair protein RadC